MSKISNRDELFSYINARLGSPCLGTSDLVREQFEWIVDYALDRFYERAIDFAQEERILYMPLTKGESVVDLSNVERQPTAVIEALGDYDSNIWNNLNTLFTVENMMLHKWGLNLYTPDVISFQMMYDWLDFFETMYGLRYSVYINEHGKNAVLSPPAKHDGGLFTAVYVKRPEIELYKFSWVREYIFAKCLVQIGMNRSKYTGLQFPGGGTINAEMYLNKGEAMVEKLEEKLLDEWTTPPNFIVG